MNESHSTNSTYSSQYDEDEIDLGQYLHILLSHKWSIFGFAIVVTLLVTLVVFSIVPTYEATTTILIESEENNVVSIEEVYGIPGANDEYFETQNQILQSRNLAEKVIDVLKIETHPEFDPEQQGPSLRESMLSWLPLDLAQDNEVVPDYAIRNDLVTQFREQLKVSPLRN